MKSFVSSSLVVCLVTGSLLLSLTAQSTGSYEAMTRHNLLSEITNHSGSHTQRIDETLANRITAQQDRLKVKT